MTSTLDGLLPTYSPAFLILVKLHTCPLVNKHPINIFTGDLVRISSYIRVWYMSLDNYNKKAFKFWHRLFICVILCHMNNPCWRAVSSPAESPARFFQHSNLFKYLRLLYKWVWYIQNRYGRLVPMPPLSRFCAPLPVSQKVVTAWYIR